MLAVGILLISLLSPTQHNSFKEPPQNVVGLERLKNPDMIDNKDLWQWNQASWRSQGGMPTSASWTHNPSSITMSLKASDNSFYAIGVSQGGGPTTLWAWHTGNLNLIINPTAHNIVTWRGSVDYTKLQKIGCLGIGVNAWFDVTLSNGTQVPVEIFVFVYQEGVYTIPVDTFKDYGYRGSSWYEGFLSNEQHRMSWRYFYYHPVQLEKGKLGEFRFELNDALDTIRNHAGEPYASATFTLQRIDAVMEMFMSEGTFTIDKLSFMQSL